VGQAAGKGQLQAECSWPYGTTENIVWEGIGNTATLAAGSYVMTLTAVNATLPGVDPSSVYFCDRNIDLIVLTPVGRGHEGCTVIAPRPRRSARESVWVAAGCRS
jgi:hypothetical protein